MTRSATRKSRRRKGVSFFHLLGGAFLVIIVTAALILLTDSFGFASSLREVITSSRFEVVDDDGIRMIEDDYTIDTADVRLEDAHIKGSLFLSPNIGSGSVELVNVTVDGPVLVQGGGMNTIYIKDCYFKEVKVNRLEGPVRLVVSGDTVVYKATLETGATLVENIYGDAKGFRLVEVITTDKTRLSGSFDSVHISLESANVEIDSEILNELLVKRTGASSAITFPDGMVINNLYLDGQAYLLGYSEVDKAYLASSGITELAGYFNQAKISSEAGQFNLGEESVFDQLIVNKEAFNNVLNLEQEVKVSYLELNEAVEVKGAGEIEKVVIGAAGSTMEQIPLNIEFLSEVSVMIDGHEITSFDMLQALIEHGDPGYTTPAGTGQGDQTGQPDPEPQSESQPEPAPEPEPELIKEIIVREGIIVGKKLVIVILNVENPQEYRVTVSGTNIEYSEAINGFRGEVNEADADKSNVVVSRR